MPLDFIVFLFVLAIGFFIAWDDRPWKPRRDWWNE